MRSRATKITDSAPDGQVDLVSRIRQLLENSRRILVVTHVDPDGDALGTQLAFASYLRHIGKEPVLVRDDVVPDKYRFLSGVNDVPTVDGIDGNLEFETALVLECPVIARTGRAERFLNDDVTIINLDHHQDNGGFGDVNWINSKASSVGEMAYEYFMQVGYDISPVVAEYLYTAILTDTGRFRYSNTSARTMEIAGRLIDAGADTQKICDLVYYDLPPTTTMLVGRVLSGVEFFDQGRICLLTLTLKMLAETGAHKSETEGLVDFTLYNKGVLAGALLREIDHQQTKVSLRSKERIDVASLAAVYGGGGHFNAAGCTLPLPLAEAKAEVLRLFASNGYE